MTPDLRLSNPKQKHKTRHQVLDAIRQGQTTLAAIAHTAGISTSYAYKLLSELRNHPQYCCCRAYPNPYTTGFRLQRQTDHNRLSRIPRNQLPQNNRQSAIEQYRLGISQADIARNLGLSPQRISQIIKSEIAAGRHNLPSPTRRKPQ